MATNAGSLSLLKSDAGSASFAPKSIDHKTAELSENIFVNEQAIEQVNMDVLCFDGGGNRSKPVWKLDFHANQHLRRLW